MATFTLSSTPFWTLAVPHVQNEDEGIVVGAKLIQARGKAVGAEHLGSSGHPYDPAALWVEVSPGRWSPGPDMPHTPHSPALSTLRPHADPSRTRPGSLLVTGLRRERGPGLLP